MWIVTFAIDDICFDFYSDSGVIIDPQKHDLSQPATIDALKIALALHPLIVSFFDYNQGHLHWNRIPDQGTPAWDYFAYRLSEDDHLQWPYSIGLQIEAHERITAVSQFFLDEMDLLAALKQTEESRIAHGLPPPLQPKAEKKQRKVLAGHVYLLKSDTGHFKIGRTINIKSRAKTFGVTLPFEVEFAHTIECQDTQATELKLHTIFAGKRVNGEWFSLTPEDVAWIKTLKTDKDIKQ